MRWPLTCLLIPVVLCGGLQTTTADSLLDTAAFKKELENRAQRATDILLGKANVQLAQDNGPLGPCHDPKWAGSAPRVAYYCTKVFINKDPHLSLYERDNGLAGTASLEATIKDIATGATEFNDLRDVVRQSLTKPIFDSWQDNRTSVEAVDARVTALEGKLPEITLDSTRELAEKIVALENKIAALEARLRELEQK